MIGHLGADCAVNEVNGKKVINFNLAHSETFTGQDGVKVSKTIWVQCAYWAERTGIAPYLKKGAQIYITGQPEVKEFKKRDGTPGSSLTCRVGKIELLGSKKDDGAPQSQGGTSASSQQQSDEINNITEPVDDLPF